MATIDASIPLGVRPVQIESPMNALMQYAQLQGAQQQNALASMRMGQLQRAEADDQAVRQGLAAPGADPAQVLLRAGRVKESVEFTKEQRAAEKQQLELGIQKLTLGAQILSTAKDPASYEAARQTAASYGLDTSRMPPQFDPAFIQTKLQEAMSIKDQMEQKWKAADYDLRVVGEQRQQRAQTSTEQHQRATEGIQRAQLGVSQGNLGVAQQNLELRRAELSKPYEVTDPNTGQAVLVQSDKQGNVVPAKGGYTPKGGGKPLPQAALKTITEARDNAVTIDRLAGSFKPDYAGKGVLGFGADAQLAASGVMGVDAEAVEWWKNYRKQAELTERHSLFGAALTPSEQASWRSADIGPNMDPKTIQRNLTTRRTLAAKMLDTTRQDLIDAGHNPERVSAIAGRGPQPPATAPAAPAAAPGIDALLKKYGGG